MMYLYLDQTVVIYLSENNVGGLYSLKMWTGSDAGKESRD